MIKELKNQAILRAKEIISQIEDVAHSKSHMEQVLKYAQEIAKHYLEADRDMLEIACWWHDVGRLYGDEGHAKKSAEMAKDELSYIGFDSSTISKICNAIAEHSNRESLIPSTLEGKILKDADKLDFLTPKRWQMCVDEKLDWAILVGIKKIPVIRNHILNLEESKKIFDVLFVKLKEFAKNENSAFFKKYKQGVINLKILK